MNKNILELKSIGTVNRDLVETVVNENDKNIIDILEDFRFHELGEGLFNEVKQNDRKTIFYSLILRDIHKYRHNNDANELYEHHELCNTFKEVDEVVADILEVYPDLFTAPASTKFHGDYEGGLIDHSIAVYEAALKSKEAYFGQKDVYIPAIFFLLHDICKCNCYTTEKKNVKNIDTGKWETKNVYVTSGDYLSSFHGAESVIRILKLIAKHFNSKKVWVDIGKMFASNWQMAVSYHMGMYNISDGDKLNYSNAIKRFPEVLLMHHADMVASQIYGI